MARVLGGEPALALHTMLDAFIAPEHGTGWTDHLSAGLAPWALLLVVNLAYPRIRPGARAAIAASLGVLCLVGATLAVVDARATFDRASDWTGFLLAPAGLALLAFAAALTWTRGRRGRFRYLRRAGVIFGSLVVAYWLVVPVSMGLIGTHRPRAAAAGCRSVPRASLSARPTACSSLLVCPVKKRRRRNLVPDPIRQARPRRDVAPTRLRRAHRRHARIRRIRRKPECVRLGRDEGHRRCRSWLRRQPDVQDERVGGIGFSVGGEIMLQAAAENHHLRAVVSDGAGERSVRATWLGASVQLSQSQSLPFSRRPSRSTATPCPHHH